MLGLVVVGSVALEFDSSLKKSDQTLCARI